MKLPKTPSFSLKNKRALVAGASSGIGLACAVALCERGASVTIAARRKDKLKNLSNLLKKNGYSVETMSLDVSHTKKTIKKIEDLEPFDILVNSAGIAKHSLATEADEDDFDKVIGTNFKGAYFLTAAVAKKLTQFEIVGEI